MSPVGQEERADLDPSPAGQEEGTDLNLSPAAVKNRGQI